MFIHDIVYVHVLATCKGVKCITHMYTCAYVTCFQNVTHVAKSCIQNHNYKSHNHTATVLAGNGHIQYVATPTLPLAHYNASGCDHSVLGTLLSLSSLRNFFPLMWVWKQAKSFDVAIGHTPNHDLPS